MVFKQTLDMTKHKMLEQLYFFNTFWLSEEMKDKCITIIQKHIVMKITI